MWAMPNRSVALPVHLLIKKASPKRMKMEKGVLEISATPQPFSRDSLVPGMQAGRRIAPPTSNLPLVGHPSTVAGSVRLHSRYTHSLARCARSLAWLAFPDLISCQQGSSQQLHQDHQGNQGDQGNKNRGINKNRNMIRGKTNIFSLVAPGNAGVRRSTGGGIGDFVSFRFSRLPGSPPARDRPGTG